ncbi:MAG TPA: DUF4124 domain-containing protein [Gammaproteobacteria bacterium]|nr:DUF4124 domain-containing protein [Gammaproteobacteria bacterium]
MVYNSVCYIFLRWRRPVARLLLLLLPAPGAADTIYHWTDAAGIPHFSDIAPAGPPAGRRELEPAPAGTAAAQGLRPGEKASLQAIERRLDLQHRSAQLARRHNDRATAKRRKDCRERRARQHRTGNHAARKENTNFLRQNCW